MTERKLTNEEIAIFAQRLEATTSAEEEPYFAIVSPDHSEYDSHVLANRSGVLNFAAQFLRAGTCINPPIIKEQNHKNIYFNDYSFWSDGDVFIEYIKPVSGKEAQIPNPAFEENTTKDKFIATGCILAVAILLFALTIGIIEIFHWIF